MSIKITTSFIALALLAAVASAETITYVDATHGPSGNTALAAGGTWDMGSGLSTNVSGSDNLWRLRPYGNPETSSTVYEAGGEYGTTANPENCPRLVTTVSGLPEDTYKIYAFFWTDTSYWRIRAGLTDDAGELPLYYYNLDRPVGEELPPIGGQAVTVASFGEAAFTPPPPLFCQGAGRTAIMAYLGEVTGTEFSVYIDDDPAHGTFSYRTWYDGVGYVPEPTTILLLGLGGFALLKNKKRQIYMHGKLIIICLTLSLLAIDASAAKITYVDATHGPSGNTTLVGGGTWDLGSGLSTENSGTDNLWRLRPGFANPSSAGTVYEAGGTYGEIANPEDCPRLATTVSGLPFDTYKVFVYFWSHHLWRIRASFTDMTGQLPLYYTGLDRDLMEETPPYGDPPPIPLYWWEEPPYPPDPADLFEEPVPITHDGSFVLWQAYLGTVTGTGFTVYIDDDPAHLTHDYRTWYDGVGYLPEPATVTLLALGGLALLRKKRT